MAVTTTSASSSAPDSSWIPRSVKVSIWSVTIDARPLRQRLEEVAVGDHAEALVPGVVVGLEVGVDVVAGGQLALRAPADQRFMSVGPAPAELVGERHQRTFFQRTIG